jgi:hypothetical protein
VFQNCIEISGQLLNAVDLLHNGQDCFLDFSPTHYYTGEVKPEWSDKYRPLKEIEGFKFFRADKL